MLEIRPVGIEGYGEVAVLWNAVWPEFEVDEEEIRHDQAREAHLRSQYLIASWQGESAGLLQVGPVPGSYHPRHWSLEIGVLERWRRQGIGGACYELALKLMGPDRPESITSTVRENDHASMQFAEARNFTEVKRDFQSVLNLAKLDRDLLESMAARQPSGVRIVSASSVDGPRFRHALHDLFERIRGDIPRVHPPVPLSFEDFEHSVLGTQFFLAEGTRVAMVDHDPVGFCNLYRGPSREQLHQGLTAVDKDLRGQGLAQALKARAMQWAIANGYQSVRADNDSRNVGMLAINLKLGFEPMPATISLMWSPSDPG